MHCSRRPLSLKVRWLTWRARLSVPSLLASDDERRVVSRVAAINGAVAILVISLFAWLTDLPLVFPVLGPSAFILFSQPFSAAAAPRSVVIGHFVALATGVGCWQLVSVVYGRPVSLEDAQWPTFVSAALALAVTSLLLVRLSCPHAPACATAMLIALGAATDFRELLALATAVVVLAAQAVCINKIAGLGVSAWRPYRSGQQERTPYKS
jgi:CBS domain-containing membrane protein